MKKFFKKVSQFILKYLLDFFKGIGIGMSIIVPGISGGTMAIVMGIYQRLLHAVNNIFREFKKHIVFLLVLGAGILAGVFGFSRLLELALDSFAVGTIFLFIGIIVSSLPLVFKESGITYNKSLPKKRYALDIILFLIGGAAVIGVSFARPGIVDLSTTEGFLGMLFLAAMGFITAVTLLLPGISGSLLLMTLGLYDKILHALNVFDFAVLLPYLLGVVLGIFAASLVLEKLLVRFKRGMSCVIFGFLIGSVALLVATNITVGIEYLYAVLMLAAGIGVTLLITFASKKYSATAAYKTAAGETAENTESVENVENAENGNPENESVENSIDTESAENPNPESESVENSVDTKSAENPNPENGDTESAENPNPENEDTGNVENGNP